MKTLNLNDLLLSMSYVLDFVEMDVLGVASNHSKRVAYISLVLAKELGLSQNKCFDIVALSILHDNGLTEKALKGGAKLEAHTKRKFLERFKDHCIIGEENIENFPFLTDVKGAIKYHHENYDGTGFYKLKGEEIPIMSQIISFADNLDTEFNLKVKCREKCQHITEYVETKRDKWSSSKIIDAFNNIVESTSFYLDLQDEFIIRALTRRLPKYNRNISMDQVREVTTVFSKIIDCKSAFTARHSQGLSEKVEIMADYYNLDKREKTKLLIAADLHDIGKLTIPNSILDKPGRLTDDEYMTMKTHTYYTRVCLESLKDFSDIAEWASNHHEKLDGSGYPYGLDAEDLDFNSRLMGCIDIYQALREDRPYRVGMTHKRAMEILRDMSRDGLIDKTIVEDIDIVFKNEES